MWNYVFWYSWSWSWHHHLLTNPMLIASKITQISSAFDSPMAFLIRLPTFWTALVAVVSILHILVLYTVHLSCRNLQGLHTSQGTCNVENWINFQLKSKSSSYIQCPRAKSTISNFRVTSKSVYKVSTHVSIFYSNSKSSSQRAN